jgi:hypothetical protein
VEGESVKERILVRGVKKKMARKVRGRSQRGKVDR